MEKFTAQDLIDQVQEILDRNELPDRHSFFQIEKFIIGKEPTKHSQLWSILREMQVRVDNIASYQHELEDAEDELELFDVKIEKINLMIGIEKAKADAFAPLNIQESEINIRKLVRQKESLIKAARRVRAKLKWAIEELNFLFDGYNKIVEKHGEPSKFDDDKAQREMWNEKLLEEFNLRAILQRPLDTELVKTVMCLGDDAPVKRHMSALIQKIQTKMLELNKG